VSLRYLLPCPCGRKIPVEPAQAGERFSCKCGRSIEVPTLGALRSLETVAEESKKPARGASWGLPQGLVSVGAIVLFGAVAALVFFYLNRPLAPAAVFTEKLVNQDISRLNLLQAENVWQGLREGLNSSSQPLGPDYRQALGTYQIGKYATVGEAYAAATQQYHIRLGMALAVLVLGAAVTMTGLVMAQSRRRETEPRP